ncbi:MAG: VIT domain-containing protein [Chloroflexota bacterium]
MPWRRLFLLATLIFLIVPMVPAPPARADGVIIVDPPWCDPDCTDPVVLADLLEVKNHVVEVTIDGGIAETRIDQTFHNPNDWAAEGAYLFPVPEGAAIGEFRMWVDGKPVEAKLLDAAQARQTYEDIVRRMRDPALLEYAGRGLLQASVFPIPPGEDRRVEIVYGEVLPTEGGLTRYRYGLDVERFSAAPLDRASISVKIASGTPLRAIYSPSHAVAVDRIDDTHANVGWEASNVIPDQDFDLYFSASPDPVGASIISESDPARQEGHILLIASPGIDASAETVAKDVILVLDTSGSMEGEKIAQAKQALTGVLERLNPDDRFAVVEFSTGVRLYQRDLQPASDRSGAISWVENLPVTGGTDINRALLEAFALARTDRPAMVIFLTDGLPTEGETSTDAILANAGRDAPENVRLFNFGVGYDVDTLLLDALAAGHRGRSSYVLPGEQIDEAVSSFYAGISAPVLSDLAIDWGGLDVADLSPDPLPDLFNGSQLIIAGRYSEPGEATITLSGTVNGEPRSYAFPAQSLTGDRGDGWISRLWATRRIGYLLNQIRLNGDNPELVDAIVDLSIRFGIVTPYTSYLLTEDDILQPAARGGGVPEAVQRAIPTAASGEAAVAASQSMADLGQADAAPAPQATVIIGGQSFDARQKVRSAGGRTYVNREGVWTDTAFDPTSGPPRRVVYLSDEYFALLAADPGLGAAFALGDRVILRSGGEFIEVAPA